MVLLMTDLYVSLYVAVLTDILYVICSLGYIKLILYSKNGNNVYLNSRIQI